MNQRIFTPGPWRKTGALEVIALSDHGTYMLVAKVAATSFVDGAGEHKIEPEQAKANANLIQTAPEMFELLESMLLRCVSGQLELPNADIDDIERLLNEATGDV